MGRLPLVLLLFLAACGAGRNEAQTTLPVPTSVIAAPTTSEASIPLEIDDCSAPQVTFSPLCESYELIQEWHVDRPIDPVTLARAARTGLANWATTDSEEPPRTLFCAIPDPAFSDLCRDLAERVQSHSIPIGPAIEAAVLAMADLGLEPFSYYLPPDQVGAFRSNGVVAGVGVLLDATDAAGSKCARISEVCQLQIVYVLEENPGSAAGLMPNDVIIGVDGSPIDGRGFVDTATQIAGDESGTVSLKILRGGEELTFDIERAELVVPTVEVDVPQAGVGYIRIPDFEDDIPGLVDDGLDSLLTETLHTIVVDLRDNGGGFIDVAIDVIGRFVDEGSALRTVGPGENLLYPVAAGGPATTQDLIVLVNGGTASSAEIMAAALRDLRQASLVGEPTFGKDAVQIAFELRNGGEFYVAVARWLSPGDFSVADGGLVPDHEIDLPQTLSTGELVEQALGVTR